MRMRPSIELGFLFFLALFCAVFVGLPLLEFLLDHLLSTRVALSENGSVAVAKVLEEALARHGGWLAGRSIARASRCGCCGVECLSTSTLILHALRYCPWLGLFWEAPRGVSSVLCWWESR